MVWCFRYVVFKANGFLHVYNLIFLTERHLREALIRPKAVTYEQCLLSFCITVDGVLTCSYTTGEHVLIALSQAWKYGHFWSAKTDIQRMMCAMIAQVLRSPVKALLQRANVEHLIKFSEVVYERHRKLMVFGKCSGQWNFGQRATSKPVW